MSEIFASFIIKREPLSFNAKRSHKYVSHLETEFKKHRFHGAPFSGPLYLRVYYFHFRLDTRDADNFSKKVVDALKGSAYSDDSLVICRTAANIHMPEHPEVDLTRMQEPALSTFIDASDKQEPILYIEIGRFLGSMLAIGGI